MGLVFSPVQRTTGGATPGNNVIGGSEPHSEKTTYRDLAQAPSEVGFPPRFIRGRRPDPKTVPRPAR
jgi:hypothetical protein